MAPSQTQIATSALQRLLKEEASYHKEAESQKKRISDLEEHNDDQDENRDFKLKQEVGHYLQSTIQHPKVYIAAWVGVYIHHEASLIDKTVYNGPVLPSHPDP